MGRRKKREEETEKGFLDEPSAINPLASKTNAEAFGFGYGFGGITTGAAALYAKAEREDRESSRPHRAGKPAGTQAGTQAGTAAGES